MGPSTFHVGIDGENFTLTAPEFCNLRRSCIVGVDLESALDHNNREDLCCQSVYEAEEYRIRLAGESTF